MYNKTCDNCGKEYQDSHKLRSVNTFCNRKCYNEFRTGRPRGQTMIQAECQYCGIEFKKPQCRLKTKGFPKYCCIEHYHLDRRKKAGLPENSRNKKWFICKHCGKKFSAYINQRRQYCSHYCSGQGRRRPQKICDYCMQPFYIPRNNHSAQRFCSMECSAKGRGSNLKRRYEVGKIKSDKQGYLTIKEPNHPLAWNNGWVLHHRYIYYENQKPIMKQWLLENKKEWTVHHKDGKRNNNKLENLELRLLSNHPKGISIDDMIGTLINLGYKVKAA